MPRCPGQDQRYWTAEDIFDVRCPSCGKDIEFWKDEPMRFCASCGKEVRNPRIDLGCAKWCKHAEECLGKLPGALPAIPLLEIFKAKLSKIPGIDTHTLEKAEQDSKNAEQTAIANNGEIVLAKASALIASALKNRNIKLPDDFFDDMEIEHDLAVKIRQAIKHNCINNRNIKS
jgi:endogenous inhibitor of DNA gyrase (YacG/DUF329 family)